jgi:hypothetical protein
MPTLNDIRTAGEAKLRELLAGFTRRQRAEIASAIRQYGSVRNIPDAFWERQQREMEEEATAAFLVLMLASDEWTTGEIRRQGQPARMAGEASVGAYGRAAASQATKLADQFTRTTRDRLVRSMADLEIASIGKGGPTKAEIRTTVADVLDKSRIDAGVTTNTTQSVSRGQIGGARRAEGQLGGDGAAAADDIRQRVTVQLIWRIHPERSKSGESCPRCQAVNGQPEEVWGVIFPEGPGDEAHVNCNCDLEVRAIVEPAEQAA